MLKKLDIGTSEIEQVEAFNALVDAVNELQKDYDNVCVWVGEQKLKTRAENVHPDAESRPENAQDKFAEQRKWIGCVCRFWYDNPNDTLLDYLDKIQTGKNGVIQYYAKESGDWFPHCEPVKPDDDIIYKKEKCETPAENVQQVSYMAPGDITVFHGFNCSVEFDTPLPQGTRITIKTITKGE